MLYTSTSQHVSLADFNNLSSHFILFSFLKTSYYFIPDDFSFDFERIFLDFNLSRLIPFSFKNFSHVADTSTKFEIQNPWAYNYLFKLSALTSKLVPLLYDSLFLTTTFTQPSTWHFCTHFIELFLHVPESLFRKKKFENKNHALLLWTTKWKNK